MDIVTLHLISLIVTAPVILYADHMGFQYLTGRVQTIGISKLKWTHNLVTFGILLLIITGIIITVPMWAIMLENPFFYAKLAFVSTLVLNGAFIGALMKKATTTPFAELSSDEKRLLLLSGGISALGWIATTLIGFFGL